MHAVRTAIDRVRAASHGSSAFGERAGVSLQGDALEVVVAVGGRELGVRRAVAGLALQPAVAGREAVEREARRPGCRALVAKVGSAASRDGVRGRRTRWRSGSVRCSARPCRCGSSGRSARPASRCASGAPTSAHAAVAALALHGERAVGGDGRAHGAAQAARRRAGMAAVAGGAVVGRVQRQARQRVDRRAHGRRGSTRVSGATPRTAAAGQRLGEVAVGAQDRACRRCGPWRRARRGCSPRPRALPRMPGSAGLALVVQPQDVEAHVALRIGIVDPAARRPRGRRASRRRDSAAVHLVGDGQHDVGRGEHGAAGVARVEAHQRIVVLRAGVVVRRERDALGDEPRRTPRRRSSAAAGWPGPAWRSRRARRRRGSATPNSACDVLPEVGLARRGRVDRAVRVGDGLVGDA